MLITSVKVTPVNKQNLLAVASITLCECFVLRAMRLMQGRRRYLAMPSRQTRTGRVFEVYHPISAEARDILESVITDGYDTQMAGKPFAPDLPVTFGTECRDLVITGVRVRPYDELKLKGFASMVLDNCLVINGIKIIIGRNRKFVQMPNVKKKTGKFRDLAFPTVPAIRELIEKKVFEEYDRALAENERAGNELTGDGFPGEGFERTEPAFNHLARNEVTGNEQSGDERMGNGPAGDHVAENGSVL